MQELNFPSFDYKLTKRGNKIFIFDLVRKKFISLTPEEWVRQHLINYLINVKGYSKNLLALEGKVNYNNLLKRFDLMACNKDGSPFLLVECKATSVKINEEALFQLSSYVHKNPASYIAITNGIDHLIMPLKTIQKGPAQIIDDFPYYSQ